jgi:hypothetical protein
LRNTEKRPEMKSVSFISFKTSGNETGPCAKCQTPIIRYGPRATGTLCRECVAYRISNPQGNPQIHAQNKHNQPLIDPKVTPTADRQSAEQERKR